MTRRYGPRPAQPVGSEHSDRRLPPPVTCRPERLEEFAVPELLVVEPVFAERLWGGTTLRHMVRRHGPARVIGECWAVSGMHGMSGRVQTGAPRRLTLRQAWHQRASSPGTPRADDLPLLCKFLDPQDWLSVQVHPNDEQARELEGQPRGKAECWLVVSCPARRHLILGHTATPVASCATPSQTAR